MVQTPLDPNTALPVTSNIVVNGASLVFNGSEFAMAWMDARDGNFEIYFARMGLNGMLIGTEQRITDDVNLQHVVGSAVSDTARCELRHLFEREYDTVSADQHGVAGNDVATVQQYSSHTKLRRRQTARRRELGRPPSFRQARRGRRR